MASILTNASAMTALQTLTQTNKNLETTQSRIATGLRVATASDNAAYWSIATGMRAQNNVLSTVRDSLGFGAAVTDTAYTALSEAIDLAQDIQAKYVSLQQGGVDATAVNAEITELKAQIVSIAQTADFEGQNLLKTGGTALNIVSGYVKGSGAVSTLTVAAYDLEAEVGVIADVATAETALDNMRAAAAQFGAKQMRIESQTNFTSQMMDAIDRGIGQLVDADMNAESARLAALQTQQQLGIQALSIANQNAQSILSLFR